MKRYGMHFAILLGLVLLVTLPTIGLVNYLDASATASETYKEGTRVAAIDLSNMTKEEATARLNKAVSDYTTQPFTVTLMDGTMVDVGKDVVTLDVTQTLETIDGPGDYTYVVSVDEAKLSPYIEGQPVTATMLLDPITTAASTLESSVTLEAAASTNEVVASFTVSPTPGMQAALDRMNGFEMNAGDTFSLKAFGDDYEALTTLGTAFYRLFAATPFTILERVPHDVLPAEMEIGFDVKVDERSNFAVQNSEQSAYSILVLNEGGTVTVQLMGQPFADAYEARVEEVISVPYRKIVRYSPTLPSGTSTVTQSGQNGQSGKLYRVVIKESGETLSLLGFDFYEPTPEIVTESSVPLPPPEPVEPVIPTFPDEPVEETPQPDDEPSDGTDSPDSNQPPVEESVPTEEEAVG